MYAAFTRSAFQTRLAYRSEVWASVFGQVVVVFAKIAVWTAVFQGAASVDGVTLLEMITYALLSGTLLAAWEWQNLLHDVGRSIETGDVAVYLLKPMHYPLYLFASECGNLAFRLVAVVVPTVAIVGATYGVLPPASGFHAVLFVVYWLLSFGLLFLISAMCGLLAFWLMTAFSLEWLLIGVYALLSGSFVPFWFFPEGFAAVGKHLPFAYLGYYPTAVYLGKLGTGEALVYLGLGLVWVALLLLAVTLLWRRARMRILIQGG